MATRPSRASFEHQLPPEIRNQIYGYVVNQDVAHVARKTLRGKYIFCSRRLPVFCSTAIRHEYRQVLAGKMLGAQPNITAVVQDFDFKNVTRFLREREDNHTLGDLLHQGGSSRLRILLKFTSKFDGTVDRATTWMKFSKGFAKKHGSGLRTVYSVYPVKNVPAMGNFKAGLRFDQDVDGDSEWAKMLKGFWEAFAPPAVQHEPSTYGRMQRAEEEADRAYDARLSDLVAAGIDPDELDDEDDDEDLEPNILPPDDLEIWGGDEWVKELLGDNYGRIPEQEAQEEEEVQQRLPREL